MKVVLYTLGARKSLRAMPPDVRQQLEAKLRRYAATGADDVQKLQGASGARLRSGDYRMIFTETEQAIEVLAVGRRREIYRWRSRVLTAVQIIKTGGEDLVVLSRRDYDALLARGGDPAAEDVMTARIVAEAEGSTALPGEVLDRILDGENPIAVLIGFRKLSQAALAKRAGLSQPFISKLMRGEVRGGRDTMEKLRTALGVSADVLGD